MRNTQKLAWQALEQHQQQIEDVKILDLFNADPQRFSNFSLRLDDLLLDFSKQQMEPETLRLLYDLAQASNLQQAIKDLFNGSIVNVTEQRAALHTELRNPNTKYVEITAVLAQMADFVRLIQQSEYTEVLVLGIGGSDLGPRLVCEALAPYKTTSLNMHFIANVDADTLIPLLQKLQATNTICLINSKTFTTIETLANAKIIKQWFGTNFAKHLWAATEHVDAAIEFGVFPENIFRFWDWVGGRFSVWSPVGLSIALTIGMENFTRFLAGAHVMDQHFATTEFSKNLPVTLALIGIWQINFKHYPTLAIIPYADRLQLLPAYLQQLEMESNGKFAAHSTAPVIWGGVGCNAQHAYMQMLHQGTQVVPVDFLVARRNHVGEQELQKLLIASCLGQSQALLTGRVDAKSYKACPGNRPSTTIMFDAITPEIMGKLIALYEHKVYVQGVLWGVQSFDQWGVQLGKDLIREVLQSVDSGSLHGVGGSTASLVRELSRC